MPSLDKFFLENLRANYNEYKCFIESGTYTGDTIFNIETLFDKLYTIEISETLYKNTSNFCISFFNKFFSLRSKER